MSGDDAFLKELQVQCLEDKDNFVVSIRESLVDFKGNLQQNLREILKSLHNIKGNYQAVGFTYFSTLIDNLETAIGVAKEKLEAHNYDVLDEDITGLEFFLSDTMNHIESYIAELRESLEDSEDKLEARKFSVDAIETIEFHAEGASPESTAPAEESTSEAEPEVEAKADTETPMDAEVNSNEAPTPETVASDTPETTEEATVIPMENYQKQEEEESKEELYLLCKQKHQFFAVPIASVLEIVEWNHLNPLPCMKKGIKGLLNLRGEPISVLDVFPEEESVFEGKNYIVIYKYMESTFGFEVEEAQQVISLDKGEFQKVDAVIDSESDLISSVSIVDEKNILILNLDRLVG